MVLLKNTNILMYEDVNYARNHEAKVTLSNGQVINSSF